MQDASLTPILRYEDPETAANWLCEVFEFRPDHVSKDEDGEIAYVALRCGRDVFLLCPTEGLSFDPLMVQPNEIGGQTTQCHYLRVDQVDEVCARAALAGAKVEIEPEDDGSGGRFCALRDPEGHLWSLGTRTYRAVAPAPVPTAVPTRKSILPRVAVLTLLTGVVVGGALGYGDELIEAIGARATSETGVGGVAPSASVAGRNEGLGLRRVAAARSKMEAKLRETRAQIASITRDKRAAEQTLKAKESELEAAQRAIAETEKELTAERAQVETLKRTLAETESQLSDAKQEVREIEASLELSRAKSEMTTAAIKNGSAAAASAKQSPKPKPATQQTQALSKTAAIDAKPKPTTQQKLASTNPAEPANSEASKYKSRCAREVYNRILLRSSSKSAKWKASVLNGLCKSASSSPEPARCFARIMQGHVKLGAGRGTRSAIRLCAGTRSASRTLGCFTRTRKSGADSGAAIKKCARN